MTKRSIRRHQEWRRLKAVALAAMLASCSASAPEPPPSATRPKVVATSSVLCDLTEQIAADTIALKCLLPGGSDPHVYEPTPEDRKAIEEAQLLLYAGYNLEPSLEKIINATSNSAPKVAVSEAAVTEPLMGKGHHHHEGEEEHPPEGEEKNAEQLESDPHVWHDAKNGIKMAEVIAQNLEKIAPERAELYRENAAALATELKAIDTWIQAQIATIPAPARRIVTTHDALGYYARAYNIPLEGVLQGLSTEQKPSAARLKTLIEAVKKAGVPTVFAEATANPKAIATVAKEANVTVAERPLLVDSLGEAGSAGETYQKMLLANTQAIVEGLGGQFSPFAK